MTQLRGWQGRWSTRRSAVARSVLTAPQRVEDDLPYLPLAEPPKRALRALALVTVCFGSAVLSAYGSGVVASCAEASLRAALQGGGQVSFSADCSITLTQPIFISEAATTIDAVGHNVQISGGGSVRLIEATTNLVLRGLNLINGGNSNAGSALYIHPGATVVASHCVFGGNSVTAPNGVSGSSGTTNSSSTGANGGNGTAGGSAQGGAVYNLGNLALINCSLTNNTAKGGNGGNGGNGGTGTGTFTISGNGGNGAPAGAALGGAIYNLWNLTLVNCSFSGNSATGGAGGAGGSGGAGTIAGLPGNGAAGGNGAGGAVFNGNNLTVLASTFSGNTARGGNSAAGGAEGNGNGMVGLPGAPGSGGALCNEWWAVATNCTFFTNVVVGGNGGNGGNGGGTFQVPGDGGDGGNGVGGAVNNANTITIVNCTFSSSAAFAGTNGVAGTGRFTARNGKMGNASGGNLAATGGQTVLMNSILASSVSGMNAFGSLVDAGYNLSSDAVGSFGGLSVQNTNPKLGNLAANGGPTLTMALLSGSPAIDRIGPDAAPSTDQRGFPRPFNRLSDIGAFEFGAATSTPGTNATLSIVRASSGSIQLSGGGASGQTLLVQASTNLVNWQTIATNVAPVQFSDPTTNVPAKFYRLSR